MKIPESIKVGGHTYKIEWVKNLIRDDANRGCLYWHTHLIKLDDNMAEDTYTVSLLHEIIHSIDRHYCNDHISEDDTASLAEGLFQVLSDMGVTFER